MLLAAEGSRMQGFMLLGLGFRVSSEMPKVGFGLKACVKSTTVCVGSTCFQSDSEKRLGPSNDWM